MERIGNGKAVALVYRITDTDGQVVEQIDVPVGYVHGADSGLFGKVEAALVGLTAGSRVEVKLSPAEGFGDHDPALTFTDDIDNVPPEFRHVGAEVEMTNDRQETQLFRVTRISDGKLTVDGNHPFAGMTVIFHVDVQQVRAATPDEISSGHPQFA